MAITKRARVCFDLKLVIHTEIEQELIRKYIRDSKRIIEGDETLSSFDRKLALVAALRGPEAAIELDLNAGIVGKIKAELSEDGATFSQYRVRFTR